jgi:hypothetical protein
MGKTGPEKLGEYGCASFMPSHQTGCAFHQVQRACPKQRLRLILSPQGGDLLGVGLVSLSWLGASSSMLKDVTSAHEEIVSCMLKIQME